MSTSPVSDSWVRVSPSSSKSIIAPPSSTSTTSIVPEYDFTQKVSSGHYIPVNPLRRQRKHRTRKLLRKMKERFTRRRPVGGKKLNKKHQKKHTKTHKKTQ